MVAEEQKVFDDDTTAELIRGYALMSPINLELANQAEVADSEAWETATEFLRSVKNGDC